MEKFTTLEGVAAPLRIINVDTDMIIPKQYLKTIKRTGLGVGLPFQSDSAPVQMPNMVWLYRVPILLYWAEHDETLGQIITHVLVHEIGHHFGLSDDDMMAIEEAAG